LLLQFFVLFARDDRHVDGLALDNALGDDAERRVGGRDLVARRFLELRQEFREQDPKGSRAEQANLGRTRRGWRRCNQQQT
jgi:hypothetical protein